MQSKNAPDFLNKKFYKKPNEFEPAIKSPINYDQSPRFFPKETAKTPQMTWLNKKIKTDNFNPIENMGS